MKRVIILAMLMISGAYSAMIYEAGAQIDYYNPSAEGDFSYTQNGQTTQTHFSNQNESSSQLSLYLEHPIPVLPNIRIDATPKTVFYGLDSGVTSKVSITQTDIIPYYELVDSIVDFDIGVAFRIFEGKVEGRANQSIDAVIPMGYAALGVDIPSTKLRIQGDLKYAGYRNDTLDDMRIQAVWKILGGMQAQAGYRHGKLNVNNHMDMNAKVTIQGPFIGIGFVF